MASSLNRDISLQVFAQTLLLGHILISSFFGPIYIYRADPKTINNKLLVGYQGWYVIRHQHTNCPTWEPQLLSPSPCLKRVIRPALLPATGTNSHSGSPVQEMVQQYTLITMAGCIGLTNQFQTEAALNSISFPMCLTTRPRSSIQLLDSLSRAVNQQSSSRPATRERCTAISNGWRSMALMVPSSNDLALKSKVMMD